MGKDNFVIGMSYVGCFLVLESLGVLQLVRSFIVGGA